MHTHTHIQPAAPFLLFMYVSMISGLTTLYWVVNWT